MTTKTSASMAPFENKNKAGEVKRMRLMSVRPLTNGGTVSSRFSCALAGCCSNSAGARRSHLLSVLHVSRGRNFCISFCHSSGTVDGSCLCRGVKSDIVLCARSKGILGRRRISSCPYIKRSHPKLQCFHSMQAAKLGRGAIITLFSTEPLGAKADCVGV